MGMIEDFHTNIIERFKYRTYFQDMAIISTTDINMASKIQTELATRGVVCILPYPEMVRSQAVHRMVELQCRFVILENQQINTTTGLNKNSIDIGMKAWGVLEGYTALDMFSPIRPSGLSGVDTESNISEHHLTFSSMVSIDNLINLASEDTLTIGITDSKGMSIETLIQ